MLVLFVGTGFSLIASIVFGAGGLGHEASSVRPPWASLAPMLSGRPSLGTGTRLRAPTLAVGMKFSFSVFRI